MGIVTTMYLTKEKQHILENVLGGKPVTGKLSTREKVSEIMRASPPPLTVKLKQGD